MGNFGYVCGHDSPYRSFALSLEAPSALPMLPLEKKEGANQPSAPKYFLTSVFTQQLCSCPEGPALPFHAKHFLVGHASGSLCNPTCYPHHRHMSLNPALETGHGACPVPTRVTFTVSPGRTALQRGWVKDSSSQCAISGVVTGRSPPCYP